MCGIDVHMDPNIGKRLNALGNTLTTLTGEEDIDDIADLNSVIMADLSDEDEVDSMSPTVHSVCLHTTMCHCCVYLDFYYFASGWHIKYAFDCLVDRKERLTMICEWG